MSLSACGKVPAPLLGVNHFVSLTQHMTIAERHAAVPSCQLLAKTCKTRSVFHTEWLFRQRLHEVPELDRRKFTEAILDIALGGLQNDPARHPAAVAAHEVQAPPHGTDLGVGLQLEVHVPTLVPALELSHVLGAVMAGEGGCHTTRYALPVAILPVRFPLQ